MSTTLIRVNGKAPAEAADVQAPGLAPPVWVDENPSLRDITDDIARPLEARRAKAGGFASGIAFAALLNLGGMVSLSLCQGNWQFGPDNSVGWAFDITISFSGLVLTCRYADLGHLLLFPSQCAPSIQSLGGGHDDIRVMCAGLFPQSIWDAPGTRFLSPRTSPISAGRSG